MCSLGAPKRKVCLMVYESEGVAQEDRQWSRDPKG